MSAAPDTAPPAIGQLAWICLGVSAPDWWRRFAALVGYGFTETADGTMLLRADSEREFRLVLEPAGKPGAAAIGWELDGPQALERMAAHLAARGLQVEQASREACVRRRVERMLVVRDPDGLRNELYWGPGSALRKAFASPVGTRFESGALGNGHLTMAVSDAQAMLDFYVGGLGLRLSDAAWMERNDRVYFLRCNPRHHSFAFAQPPDRGPRTMHVMSDLDSLDTLGEVRDRLLDAGLVLNRDLGSHPLDGVVSVYVDTPEGFDFELACGTRIIDEVRWEIDKHQRRGRPWGHRRPLPTKDRM